jgi:HD-like signal output (HDOD) protein
VALESALRRIRLKGEFPALPSSLARITRLAASDQQNLQVLAAAVLSDAALTQKLLRTVNAATYRSFGGGAVSTVSRAIQLLGYGAVRTAATSLPLLDFGKDRAQAGRVLDEILLAAFCGSLAQDLSGLSERDAEEAFVCGSLHRLGPMLLTFYFPEEAAEIDRLNHQRPGQRSSHVLQVLGLDDEALAVGVAKLWGFPELLTRSLRAIVDPVSMADAGAVAIRIPVVAPAN